MDENNIPKRRPYQPRNAEISQDEPQPETVTPDPNKPETIPPNLFSGMTRRLEFFGDHPGFRRRWFNDDKGGNNIRDAERSGWLMVNRKDVKLFDAATPRNNDLGSHVRQYVGLDEQGNAMYAYLMEKPLWLCELHDYGPGSRHEYHEKIKQQIMGGTLGQKAGERRYSAANPPPGGTSLPPIAVNTKISR